MVNGDLDVSGGGTCEVGGALNVDGFVDADVGGVLEVHGPITGSPGAVLNMGTGTLSVYADVDLNNFSSVNWKLGGTIEGRAYESYEVDFGGSIEVADVFVYHASDSVKVTLRSAADSLHVKGNLNVFQGAVLTDLDITVDGDTNIEVDGKITGSINESYEVDFNGTIEVAGDFEYTFPKVVINMKRGFISGTFTLVGDSSFMRVAPGDTIRVLPTGALNVFSDTDVPAGLLLDGSVHSGQWQLDIRPGATTQLRNVRVQDSDASPGETAVATGGHSVDDGNNLNWNFVASAAEDTPPLKLSVRAVPNPFNPHTSIHYTVPHTGRVTIRIYDVAGRLVRTLLSDVRAAGAHTVPWDGRDRSGGRVGSGVYFCRVQSEGASAVHKLVLLR
jgi:hypothetical protein